MFARQESYLCAQTQQTTKQLSHLIFDRPRRFPRPWNCLNQDSCLRLSKDVAVSRCYLIERIIFDSFVKFNYFRIRES